MPKNIVKKCLEEINREELAEFSKQSFKFYEMIIRMQPIDFWLSEVYLMK